VFDPMSAALGGTSGSAGLFSDAGDLARFARMVLGLGALDGVRVLREESVRAMTRPADPLVSDTRGLGWDTRSPSGYTVAGRFFGPRSFGHPGDTGTSLWIDPDAGAFVVLLSNRTEPPKRDRRHVHVRPAVSDYGWLALGLPPVPAAARATTAATTS
jgi:CubicO group peptidase (beta-lactamase class C family)